MLALLLGSVASVAPAPSATAQTLPEFAPEVAGLVEPILVSVAQILGSLAPFGSFEIDEEGELFSGGAGVEISGGFACAKTLDLAPLLPHVTSQSITVDVAQAGASVTRARGRIESADMTCDGADKEFTVFALVDGGAPLRAGPVEVVVRMSVCDLLGCTTAAAVSTINAAAPAADAAGGDGAGAADAAGGDGAGGGGAAAGSGAGDDDDGE